MNGYEKYMDRQRMSDTGMARLVKLETERPPKARKRVPQWVKYAGMAASLVLVVGLFALPILQGAQQQRAAGPNVTDGPAEELQFQEMPHYGFFVDESQYIGKRTPVEPEDAAELFGCAPDDFAGLLETVGLSKYDMEYYTVEAYYPFGVYPKDVAALGDDGYRFVMKGSYTTPREKPENWDETSEISWEMWQGLSSFLPRNDVWLEIYEGHSYLSEADWNEVEPQAFQGHQVAAACDANSDYYAAAAFDVECDGKTYGVLYSAVTYGDCNAKEVVTQMVRYLTQSGLFIEDRGTAQVKTTGLYVMERGESDNPVMPRIHFDGESYTFGQSLLSSHLCRGGYEVANGRVTARCDEHHFVFDILDENTLRFVGSESSAPVSYKGEPQITDGAVFRWQEIVWGEEIVPEVEGTAEAGVEPSGVFYLEPAEGETLFYPYLNLSGNGNTFSWQRGEDSCRSGSYAVADGKVRCHRSGKTYVFEAVDEDTLRYVGAESDTLDYLDGDSITRTLPDGAVLRRNDAQLGALDAKLQLGGKYHMETADGSALADSYLDIERKKPYGDIINKKMTVHFASRDCVCNATDYNAAHDRVTYVCSDCKSAYTFDIVDSETLRYVASGDKDCIDDCTVFRQLKDGERAVTEYVWDDAGLRGAWVWGDATHHPEQEHNVEVTHHSDSHH